MGFSAGRWRGAVQVALVVMFVAGCSRAEGDWSARGLDAPSRAETAAGRADHAPGTTPSNPPATSAVPDDAPAPTVSEPRPASPAPGPAGGMPQPVSALPEEALITGGALAEYNRTLNTMIGDAAALADPEHPAVAAWRNTITSDSPLHRRVYTDSLLVDFARDRTVFVPDAAGRAHHHRISRLLPRSAGEIVFDYCNWAPIVEIRVGTLDMVDDTPLFEQGHGTLRLEGGRWLVHELDSIYSEEIPAGGVDLCATP